VRQFLRISAVVALAILLGAAVTLAANTLEVSSPGLDGSNFKLEINTDGIDNSQKWVQDDSPECEATYNFEFGFATPDLAAGELDLDDNYSVFLGRQVTGGASNEIRCLLRSQPGGAFNPQVRCSVREDNGVGGTRLRFIGQSAYNPSFEHSFRVELVKDTGLGDGSAIFYRDGVQVFSRNDLANDDRCWDAQRLGLGQPIPANSLGKAFEMDFDNFVSTR